jgi:hypothetical protein
MMQYMRNWVQAMGHKQHDVLRRLSKQAVRNHENIRGAGEGGPPETQTSYASNQAHHLQQNIHGYVASIPVVGQAQQFMGQFSGGSGPRREMPSAPGGPPTGFPNSPTRHETWPGTSPPLPTSGEAASFYAGNNSGGGSASGYPPQAPPPSFPSMPDTGGYAPNYSSPPPAFPDYNPGGYGAYAPPSGSSPPGGGPGFPGPAPYGAPPPNFPSGPPPPGPGGYPPPGGYNQYGGSGW